MALKKKTVPVVVETQEPPTLWQRIKNAFYRSEVVFLAFIAQLTGIVTTMVGYFDFAPLWNTLKTGTAFTQQQLIGMGIGIFGAGIVTYIARVRGTKAVNGELLPKAD